jgi:multiple antibiotic resistance protein
MSPLLASLAPVEILQAAVLVLAALFPIVNPLGGAPIFLSLTAHYPVSVQRALARRIAVNSFFLLVASILIGTHVLAFFGVSLPAVQVGGGLLVAFSGWTLLNAPDSRQKDREAPSGIEVLDHSFYPYTLPLTVGPGSISVAMTLGAHMPKRLGGESALSIGPVLVALLGSASMAVLIWALYGSAERIGRVLGPSGTSVVVRLSAFILLCIGVQITWNGLRALAEPLLRQ